MELLKKTSEAEGPMEGVAVTAESVVGVANTFAGVGKDSPG